MNSRIHAEPHLTQRLIDRQSGLGCHILPMLKQFSHCGDLLAHEFSTRRARNSRYSLSAFARDLKLSTGTLSRILGKKLGLSEDRAGEVAENLGLSKSDRRYFKDLSVMCYSRREIERESARIRMRAHDTSYNSLELDRFHIISTWYHFGILELVSIKGFQESPAWIAKRLRISEDDARDALARLIRVGVLIHGDKGLKPATNFVVLPSGSPDQLARQIHREALTKALQELESSPPESREFSTTFLRMSHTDLEHARLKLKEGRRALVDDLEKNPDADAVYILSTQLFRLDHEA